jgi:Putative bacterial sensory transduction regulator
LAVAPIASPEERARCDAAIVEWASSVGLQVGSSAFSASTAAFKAPRAPAAIAVERDPGLERWYVRLKGAEKDVVTIWLTVRQRTLHHEAHFMPAPETNVCETYEYLLRRNSVLHGMQFSLGAEDAVYLVGEIPVGRVTVEEIDRIVGTSLEYVDTSFPEAMTLGHARYYRRRRRPG